MATEILLPILGFSVNGGAVTEWLVPDGGNATAGQLLYLLESDKSVQEIESPAIGTLKILKPPGAMYEVGTVIGEVG